MIHFSETKFTEIDLCNSENIFTSLYCLHLLRIATQIMCDKYLRIVFASQAVGTQVVDFVKTSCTLKTKYHDITQKY